MLSKFWGVLYLKDGGTFSTILEDLEQCGFIRYYVPYNGHANGGLFQLMDNFTLFYYHCIRKNAFGDEHYWTHTYLSNDHNVWAGLAFERVCLQHVTQLKEALKISGILSHVCSWNIEKTENHKGAQIDLLFSRADRVINLFEIKYCKTIFELDAKLAKELESKLTIFKAESKTKDAVHLTLITTEGVTHNSYWKMLQKDLDMNSLFL